MGLKERVFELGFKIFKKTIEVLEEPSSVESRKSSLERLSKEIDLSLEYFLPNKQAYFSANGVTIGHANSFYLFHQTGAISRYIIFSEGVIFRSEGIPNHELPELPNLLHSIRINHELLKSGQLVIPRNP